MFLAQYNPLSTEPAQATIIHKNSEIRLSFSPKYYMTVNDEYDGSSSKTRVSKRAMISTNIGDQLTGYRSKGQFFTTYQLLIDMLYFTVLILVGIALCLLGSLIFIRKTPVIRKLNEWLRLIRRDEKIHESIKYLLLIGAVIFLFGGYVLHFFQVNFSQHVTTEAVITDMERKPGYGRFATSTYSLTLKYDSNASEPTETKIKVSKEAFDFYKEGNTIDVLYQKRNPYYVFLPSEVKLTGLLSLGKLPF